jgi:hypothetical protein
MRHARRVDARVVELSVANRSTLDVILVRMAVDRSGDLGASA